MKRLILLLCLVSSAILISGCGTVPYTPVATEEVSIFFRQGLQLAEASGKETNVQIGLVQDDAQLNVIMFCQNTSSGKLTVFPSQVYVSALMDGTELVQKVYDPEEYLAKIRTSQAVALAMEGVSNAIDSANAGYSSSYGTYGGSIYNGVGNSSIYGSDYIYRYGAADAAKVNAQNQQELQNLAANMQEDYDSIESSLLRASTLLPGQECSGRVIAKFRNNASRYVVRIKVAQDEYSFEFYDPKPVTKNQ